MNSLQLIESTVFKRHIVVKIRSNICLKFYSSSSMMLNVLLKFISSTLFKKRWNDVWNQISTMMFWTKLFCFVYNVCSKKINFYFKNLKTCAKRIKKSDQSEIKIYLKQNDFNRREKNTMNKSMFDEIVIVIIMFDDQSDENSINKNILI